MKIQLVQHHIELTEKQKDYINAKVENIQKYERRVADEASQIRVDIERHKVKSSSEDIELQITLRIPHSVIRAEVRGATVEEATDKAMDKIKKQIERYKTRKHRRNKAGEWIPQSTLEDISDTSNEEFNIEEFNKIIRRKKFSRLQPMHEDEAVEQMELLDHNFFAFLNADTNLFSVLYRREGSETGYGIIELDTTSI